jgi:hypothetical protein
MRVRNWAIVLAGKDNTISNPEFIYAEIELF